MKKAMILVSLVTTLMSQLAFAGLTRFDSTQFNDIIAENQKQEKELRHKLQDQAGIDYKIKKAPLHIDRKEVVGDQAEQVAVSSSSDIGTDNSKLERTRRPSDRASMKRLSQELDQENQ